MTSKYRETTTVGLTDALGPGERRILLSPFISPRSDFLHSQLADHNDQSTLMNTVLRACASSTAWISVPCLTTTKARFSGAGLLGVWPTMVPVQSGLTV